MKSKITLLVAAFFLVIWLGKNAFAETEIPGMATANVAPADTGKKNSAPPPPPLLQHKY
jgi:hypothetical protein